MASITLEQSSVLRLGSLNQRGELLLKMKGQTAQIPDLKPIFDDWKGVHHHHISPWVEALRDKVKERIQSFNFGDAKQKQLEKSDIALFAALWWPEATLERLQILAFLIIWLFTWDDEIDEPTGAYSEDLDGAQAYRDDTLRFVEDCVGLSDLSSSMDCHFRPLNQIIQSFDVIGSALCASYDASQLRRFRDEIARFIKASEAEQRGRLGGEVLTIHEYWAFRLGTSAVYVTSAAGEYSMSARLPPDVMDYSEMRALWDETNIIVSITNDLLSLKKEVKLGCIDSIVPLTFASTNDIHKAISLSVAALRASKERFDEAAKALLTRTKDMKELYKQVEGFIEVQRSNCVGNLVWSLETKRYDVSGDRKDDRSLQFTF